MAHWDDLMELDSDSYTTPNSTMTQVSPVSETGMLDALSSSSGLMTEDRIGDTAATKVSPDASAELPGVGENEAEDDSGAEQELGASSPNGPLLPEPKRARRMVFSSWYTLWKVWKLGECR